jgi:hypothetical protein
MKIRCHFNTLPLLALLGAATAAEAQVQRQLAQQERVPPASRNPRGSHPAFRYVDGPVSLVFTDPRAGRGGCHRKRPRTFGKGRKIASKIVHLLRHAGSLTTVPYGGGSDWRT